MAVINVFGGNGFVGNEYCNVAKEKFLIKNARNNYAVSSADVV